jgi:hypothetical protein
MFIRFIYISCFLLSLLSAPVLFAQLTPQQRYDSLQATLARGWNTWNTQSVLSHVLLPEGLALNICLLDTRITGERYLREAYISQKSKRPETITPGLHAYDGSYTELELEWNNARIRVQSARVGEDLLLLVTPLQMPGRLPHLVLESGMLWNLPGQVFRKKETLQASLAGRQVTVKGTGILTNDYVPATGPYLSFLLEKPLGIYTGDNRSLQEITQLVERQKAVVELQAKPYGNLADTYQAVQTVMAWNTIYDPVRGKVITPVSRFWNTFFGGNSVLFCWDTYFAAMLASLDNKELAYANAVEVSKAVKQYGMVPNYVGDAGLGSPDRSQPPVGSRVVLDIYRKYGEKWFLELLFDDLLTWNRWWIKHRATNNFLCWGSDSLPPPYNDDASNNSQGAAYESGLDNSPMYDKVPFNKQTHLMELADVGLMSLFIMDCQSLAEIALLLERKEEARELKKREALFTKSLQSLWDEEQGIFLNRRTDTGEKSKVLSPTSFYPLLARVASPAQAKRMMKEHYYNPQEFYGEWVVPSTPRNNPTFESQDYWRGRIWGPMNYLVYLGLRNYDLPDARKDLVSKSNALLLKTWHNKRLVHENYHGITGNGLNMEEKINRSDSFYHWGALLGLIPLLDAGFGEVKTK